MYVPSASGQRTTALAAIALGSVAFAAPPAALAAPPSPGPQSIGDSLFPTLGNGGYDAIAYDFNLTFGADPAGPVKSTVTLAATATQALSSFSLDYAGSGSGGVFVNGQPAKVVAQDGKLVITPKRALPARRPFVVTLQGFVTGPRAYDPNDETSTAFFAGPTGTAVAAQPANAHFAFPVNDHPLDKAAYTFRLTAPAGQSAVASGALIDKRTKKGQTTWTYLQRQPLAAELIQIAVGSYDIVDRGRLAGVKVRDVIPPSLRSRVEPAFARVGDHLQFVQGKLGRYPFDTYGSLLIDDNVGFALETQTLSLYGPEWFIDPDTGEDHPPAWWEPTLVHELAHQWWGDSVSPKDWSDIWINEGHATWYEASFAQREEEREPGYFQEYLGVDDFEDAARVIYSLGDRYRAAYGPVGAPRSGASEDLFSRQAYYGGFLVLYALRQEIGVAKFEKLEREYVTRYEGQSRGTDDFIALASKVAGRDLGPFLGRWLDDTTMPPMPGHPDWTVLPVEEPAPAAAESRSVAPGTPAGDPLPDPRHK